MVFYNGCFDRAKILQGTEKAALKHANHFRVSSDKATPADSKTTNGFKSFVFFRPWPAAGQARRDDALYPVVVFESVGQFFLN
jgi:hypothetical protein